MRGRMYDQTESLDWLLQLKKLKTLYLEVTDVRLYREEGVKDHHIAAVIEEYFGPARVQRLAALRNLERISVILISWWRGSNEIAEATPEFQRLKGILSESVQEEFRQVCYTPLRGASLDSAGDYLKTK